MKIAVIAVVAAFGLTSAFTHETAPSKPKKTPEEIFAMKDADEDGKVSEQEFVGKAKNAERVKARFAKLDKDQDGFLSKEESRPLLTH